ncbi:hypothetical protein T4D_13258 [Trichinella pseudospiralis]|uniref:Uncharacterized protein n=1 Tax=Trichinella pseudospiralis TaxID=6337 RepID=A0A0V1FX34_TRIPS|nr:hypothetical protein T4D_13258 [Trichinella pseudospiralis]
MYKIIQLHECAYWACTLVLRTRLIRSPKPNRKPYYSTPIATKRAGRLAGAFSRPLLAGELASPTMANTSFGIWRLCRFEKRREIPLQRCCWMRRI